MDILYKNQSIKHLLIGGMLGLLSVSTSAKQLLSEENLAQTVGEQSPAQLTQVSDDTEISVLLSEQNLEILKTQILNEKKHQYYQPLHVSLQLNEDALYNREQAQVRKTHENAENAFGLEPFSMTWNGNFQAIIDLDKINNVSFSHQTGQYEINNVQGRVTIVVDTY